jgi:hypothetical protein
MDPQPDPDKSAEPIKPETPPQPRRLSLPTLGPGMTIYGLPPVFWVGTAIFLFIFIMMFGAYL